MYIYLLKESTTYLGNMFIVFCATPQDFQTLNFEKSFFDSDLHVYSTKYSKANRVPILSIFC